MYGRGQQSGLGFGPPVTPPIIKQLLIANLAVFVLQSLYHGTGGGLATTPWSSLAARPVLFWSGGYIWQPFTYMWLHGNFGHAAMNMFALWMFGTPVAMVWGPRRFLRFYLFCGVGAGLVIVTLPLILVYLGRDPITLSFPTVGASGAVFGILLAYSLTWPDRTIMLIFPPVAFRAIWLIPLLFFMEFTFGPQNVSHEGHLGGVLVGWLLLRRQTDSRLLPSMERLKYRWRRYRMRRKLKAVRSDDRRRSWDDHTLH